MTPTTTLDQAADPMDVARAAAEQLAERTGAARHDVALVLGSGWGPAADLLGRTLAEVDATDLDGFHAPSVAGHAGTVRSVAIGDSGRRALVLPRTHFYEGKGVRAVVHGVRTAAAAGCSVVVLTNGCGGLDRDWPPGHPGAHLRPPQPHRASRRSRAPRSSTSPTCTPRRLRALCREVDPDLAEGVYAQFRGPQYETPAEVRMAGDPRRRPGRDVHGPRGDRRAGRRAWRSSACPSSPTWPPASATAPLDHAEVLAAGRAAAERCGRMLADVVQRL